MKKDINNPLYLDNAWFPVDLVMCLNEKAWNKLMKQMGLKPKEYPYPSNDGSITSFEIPNGYDTYVMVISERAEKLHPIQVIGIITHEVVHMVQGLMRTIGEKEPSTEFQAYATGSITQAAIDTFHKLRMPLYIEKKKKNDKQK